MARTSERSESPYTRLVCLIAAVCCILSFVSGLVPQLEMSLSGGNFMVGNALFKGLLLVCLLAICSLNPSLKFERGQLVVSWFLLVVFLVFEIGYLSSASDLSLFNILGVYNAWYLLPLIGVPFLLFGGGGVSEKVIVRTVIVIFLICAAIGLAQHLANEPFLRTESADGNFVVNSWDFHGQVRAFSLFGSSLEYGVFCSFCGALGVALSKHRRIGGLLLLAASAFACYLTLTRLCYLLFVCAAVYALILTFGRRQGRGLWQPVLFFALGIATILAGASSLVRGDPSGIQDASSLLDRLAEWNYAYGLLSQAALPHQLFGIGISQNLQFSDLPIIIDSAPLALSLHIGLIGLLLFTIYSACAWIYLRQEALANQQPFVIAAASLWSTLLCAGTFNIIFSSFGAVFTLAVLCRNERSRSPGQNKLPAISIKGQ